MRIRIPRFRKMENAFAWLIARHENDPRPEPKIRKASKIDDAEMARLYLTGISAEEISRRAGVSGGTVRARLRRSFVCLKKRYSRGCGERVFECAKEIPDISRWSSQIA